MQLFKFMLMSSVIYCTRLTASFEVLPFFKNLLPRLCPPFPEHCSQELLLCSIPETGSAHSNESKDKKLLAGAGQPA